MADRPIIFSGPMVRAIRDGRKTMTRRVLRPQPAVYTPMVIDITNPIFDEEEGGWGQWETIWSRGMDGNIEPDHVVWQPLALKYAPGDRLWVRETYCTGYDYDDHDKPIGDEPRVFYAATECPRWYDTDTDTWLDRPRWTPSIFMRRAASRLTLIVTDVRVERLQDISEADAIAEGVEDVSDDGPVLTGIPCGTIYADHRSAFQDLWNSLHGPASWEDNPWVAAITFRPVFANIDSPEAATATSDH